MLKKRNKKYNPNKLLPSQVRKLQQASQYRQDILDTYEMSMEFSAQGVRDSLDGALLAEKELVDKFPHATTLPYHITIGAYDYQDLSIALVLGHCEKPESWSVSANITMMNIYAEDNKMITVEFRRELPSMSLGELLRGKKDCKIDIGGGLKKAGWLGLDKEIVKEIESKKNIPDTFSIELIQVYVEADIKFISTSHYREFLEVAEWANTSHKLASDRLRKLWVAEQMMGNAGTTIGYT